VVTYYTFMNQNDYYPIIFFFFSEDMIFYLTSHDLFRFITFVKFVVTTKNIFDEPYVEVSFLQFVLIQLAERKTLTCLFIGFCTVVNCI